MRTISEHVRNIMNEQPFLLEVIEDKLGNEAAIARHIHNEVEKRAYEKVSLASITMALHRLSKNQKKEQWGHRYLKTISDVTVRSSLLLWYFKHAHSNTPAAYKALSRISGNYPEVFCNVIHGVQDSMIIAHRDLEKSLVGITERAQSAEGLPVAALTMRLPFESLPVPGVYYPILQAIARTGTSLVEVVSVGTELTLICKEDDVETILRTVRDLIKGAHSFKR